MSSPSRYAIYFVPPADSGLYRFGSSMLGYDCYTGAEIPHPVDLGLPDDWAALTQAPRRYGFHATLMAPFRLAADRDEAALMDGFAAFGRAARDVPVIQPVVGSLAGFIAIVLRERDAALDRLAADCVTWFDGFRAPLSAADAARRLTADLSERERANVDRWGYPYVFDDFRFHMTLTGPMEDGRRAAIGNLLSGLFARRHGGGAVPIDRIVLMRQPDESSRFRVLREAAFGVGSSEAVMDRA